MMNSTGLWLKVFSAEEVEGNVQVLILKILTWRRIPPRWT